jgi:hypothetical protein
MSRAREPRRLDERVSAAEVRFLRELEALGHQFADASNPADAVCQADGEALRQHGFSEQGAGRRDPRSGE